MAEIRTIQKEEQQDHKQRMVDLDKRITDLVSAMGTFLGDQRKAS